MAVSAVEIGFAPAVVKDTVTSLDGTKLVAALPVIGREIVQYTITAIFCNTAGVSVGTACATVTKAITVGLTNPTVAGIVGTEVTLISQQAGGTFVLDLAAGGGLNINVSVSTTVAETTFDVTLIFEKKRASSA